MNGRPRVDLELTVISDYICPWCYIAASVVDRFQSEYEVQVEWEPYELRPNTPPGGMSFAVLRGRGRYTEEYLAEQTALAGAVGLAMRERAIIPNSRPALEAGEWARAAGVFEVLHPALFRAYFADGLDIGDIGVIEAVATDCGLDGAGLAAALREGRFREALEQRLAVTRIAGEGGIPKFIFKATDTATGAVRRAGITGAQDYAVFQSVATRLGATRRA